MVNTNWSFLVCVFGRTTARLQQLLLASLATTELACAVRVNCQRIVSAFSIEFSRSTVAHQSQHIVKSTVAELWSISNFKVIARTRHTGARSYATWSLSSPNCPSRSAMSQAFSRRSAETSLLAAMAWTRSIVACALSSWLSIHTLNVMHNSPCLQWLYESIVVSHS